MRHLEPVLRRPCCLRVTALILVSGIGFASAGCAAERGTIGAMLRRDRDQRLFVYDTPPRLAADRAGIREGDEILLVDGRDVRTFDDRALHRILSGDVGAPVKLTVIRDDEVLRVTLKRTPAPRSKSETR